MSENQIIQGIESYLGGRYHGREHPSLTAETERFRTARPFAGRTILDCTPVFANTLVKYIPLLAGGVKLSVGVSERVPHDPAVVRFLCELGVPVLSDSSAERDAFDVILDCDGTRSELTPRVGACELTRSGIYRYEGKPYPVVLVDSSRIREIETSVGTGDGFMRGMKKFGHSDWKGRSVVLFGFGKVGRGVAYRCLKEGASVTVVDRVDCGIPFERVHGVSVVDCRDRDAVRRTVETCDYLVTATGVRGAMKAYGLGSVIRAHAGITVAAIGIEDEWLDELEADRIVNRGVAVNFALEEPTLLRYIDPTMALSNQCALDLLSGSVAGAGIVSPSAASESLCLDPVFVYGLIAEEIRELGL